VTSTRSEANTTRLALIGVVLTLAAIVGRELLPQKTVSLTGNSGYWYYLSTSQAPGMADRVQWVDEKHLHYRCHYEASDTSTYNPCALTFMLNEHGKDTKGMDLSDFDSIALDLSYKGTSDFLRLGVRNFDPRFSNVKDANSSRMQSINLRARDITAPVTIGLSELTVPEWWISAFNLPRQYNVARLDNAVALSIDIPSDLRGTTQDIEIRSVTLKGEWIEREKLYLAILSLWIVSVLVFIGRRLTHLRTAHDQLTRLVRVDTLTGVLNRRGGEESLNEFVADKRPFMLFVVDLDHFKQVNDTHGHEAGDAVLRHTAGVIQNSVRAGDIVARWGGEEFLVACPDCPVEQGARIAQKVREKLEASVVGKGRGIAVTASIGVAVSEPGKAFGEAFGRADAAMYRAKLAGRNRVVLDDFPTVPPREPAEADS
jgi:diguanylate cyclase (GGDEF)-like protein